MESSNSSKTSSGGISFFGMLAILFIGLKLTGYIDWSWWWVMAPLWAPFAVVLGLLAAALTVVGLTAAVETLKGK